MKINAISSSSLGNSFVLQSGKTNILLDIGATTQDIQSALFKLSLVANDISGILITHEHQDHILGIHSLKGVTKYMTKGTYDAALEKYNLDHFPIEEIVFIEADEDFEIGDLTITPFETIHDAIEPVGFRIVDSNDHSLVFATDTGNIPIDYPNEDIYIIESNHSETIMQEKLDNNLIPLDRFNRITQYHLSTQKALKYLQKNMGDKTKHIILMHLSIKNKNPIGLMNYFRARLNTDIVSFIHPIKHKVTKTFTTEVTHDTK